MEAADHRVERARLRRSVVIEREIPQCPARRRREGHRVSRLLIRERSKAPGGNRHLGIDLGGTFIKAASSPPTERWTTRDGALERQERTRGDLAHVVEIVRHAGRRTRSERSGWASAAGRPSRGHARRVADPPRLVERSRGRDDPRRGQRPVVLENDASCAMLGEWWLGAGERKRVVAGLTLERASGAGSCSTARSPGCDRLGRDRTRRARGRADVSVWRSRLP